MLTNSWAATSILKRRELCLKFYSDKGEVFLDISPADMPERFETYQDIAVAFGWKGKEEVARMTMSAAARKRIREAQKKRWAERKAVKTRRAGCWSAVPSPGAM